MLWLKEEHLFRLDSGLYNLFQWLISQQTSAPPRQLQPVLLCNQLLMGLGMGGVTCLQLLG